MKAQLKCSNCGAEISNLEMTWGRKQWIAFIPFIIFMVFFAFGFPYLMSGGRHDFRADLAIKDVERRYADGNMEILGVIENHGKATWENIYLKADLFDKDGKFIDQVSACTYLKLPAGDSDHFKLSSKDFPSERWDSIKDMKVKVTSAYHSRL